MHCVQEDFKRRLLCDANNRGANRMHRHSQASSPRSTSICPARVGGVRWPSAPRCAGVLGVRPPVCALVCTQVRVRGAAHANRQYAAQDTRRSARRPSARRRSPRVTRKKAYILGVKYRPATQRRPSRCTARISGPMSKRCRSFGRSSRLTSKRATWPPCGADHSRGLTQMRFVRASELSDELLGVESGLYRALKRLMALADSPS